MWLYKERAKFMYFRKWLEENVLPAISITFLLISVGSNSFAQSPQTLTAAGAATWTAPACIASLTVECWGGGGGAGGNGNDPGGGSAGGGGAYSSSVLNVTPGTTYNLFVGSGGTAGNNSNGGNGGDSWFLNNTTVMAKGGNAGFTRTAAGSYAGGTGGSAASGFGTVRFSGGNGGSSYGIVPGACCGYTSGGGGGSSASPTSNGTNGGSATGSGMAKPPPGLGGTIAGGGSGGDGRGNGGTFDAGFPGQGPGGGGGGSDDHGQGAVGAAGQVRLTWVIATFTNKTATICSGGTFNITPVNGLGGDVFPPGTTYTWAAPTGAIGGGSAQGTGQSSISQTLTNASAAPQTATYNVTAAFPSCTKTFNIVVTVNPIPVLSSTLTPAAVCSNSTFNYAAASATTGTTFNWSRSAVAGITQAATSSAGNTISEVLTNSTTNPVNAVYNYTLSANTCTNTQNVSVPINPLPTATLSGNYINCKNDPNPILTFYGGSSVAPYTFTYSVNGTTTTVTSNGAGTGTLSASTATAGNFTYSLVSVTDNNSCSQSPAGNSAVVNVSPLGASLAGTTTVCLNGTAPTVTFTGSGGTAPYTFNYTINGIAATTLLSDAVTGTGTVTQPTNTVNVFVYALVSVQDATSLSCVKTTSISVTVNDLPTATIGSDVTVCQGSTAPILTLTGSGGSNPYTFSYTINNVGLQTTNGSNTATVAVPTGTATTYTYTVTKVQEGSGAACSQNLSGVSSIVSIKQPATGSLTASVTRVCQGATSPDITFTGANGPAAYIFTYTTDTLKNGLHTAISTHTVGTAQGPPASSVTTVPVPTNNADTIVYIITGVADNSGLICSTAHDTIQMIIDPLPKSTITSPGGPNQCYNPAGTVELDFTAVNVVGQITFNYTEQFGATYTLALAAAKTTPANSPLGPITVGSTSPLDTNIFVSAGLVGTTIYSNGISSSNVCAGSGSGTYAITVNPLPTATLSMNGASTICDNLTTNVRFTAGAGQPPFKFTYNINNGVSKQISTAAGTYTVDLTIDTVPGTYTVNLTAVSDKYNCNQAQTGTVTITVLPNDFITLTSAPLSPNQSICVNTLLTPITYSLSGGATGATVLPALPSGLSSSFAAGVFTISGTPTAVSTQPAISTYTVNTNGTCVQASASGTITVNPDATIALTSGAGTNVQSLCVNNSIMPITYSVSGGATSATVTPLPSGISGSFAIATGVFTISGTPTAISTQTVTTSYTVTTVGTCTQTFLTGTITVTPDATIGLTSAATTTVQTLCLTDVLATISYTVSGGGTGANITGLPLGVTGNYSGGIVTIGGTPSVVGTYTYTVATTGTCTQVAVTGSIKINPNAAITLTSGVNTNIQTLCVNTPLSQITYSVSGGATSATVTPLPAGISASFAAASGVFTISGTPTAISTQTVITSYTVTTVGTCSQTALTGTITVYPDATIALTSGNSVQAVCVNTAISPITYSINGGATGATVIGLPLGLTGSITGAGIFTISGTPTAVSSQTVVSTYTVGTIGTCAQTTLTGTIAVYPDATLALTSAPGTTAQTVCVRGTPIAPITYTLGAGAYSASVAGLPNGVSTSYAPSTGVLTISGTPIIVSTQTVVNTYTVSTSGSACVQQQLTGTIQMDPLPTAYAGSVLPICETDSVTILNALATDGSIKWTTSNGQGVLTNTTTLTPQYKASTLDQNRNVTLTMTVTSTNSCSVLPETASSSVTIFVRPTLTAVTTVTTSVCQNSPATVVFNVTSLGTPPYSFTYTQTVNGVGSTNTITTSSVSSTATISAPTGSVGKVVYSLTQVQDFNCTKALPLNTQTVIINPLPYATISQDEDVCRDSTAKQIKIKGSKGATPYTFTFNINNAPTSMTAADSVLLPPPTDKVGTFVYSLTKVSDFNGCIQTLTDKATVVVHENPNAVFTVSPERTSILEPEISITDASISASSWMWDFGDGSLSSSPAPESHTYADTGTYKIKLKVNNSLCKDSTSRLVRITLPTSLYVPSSFTPNGDGVNDIFKAEGDGMTKFEMLIFDRWGQLVFQSNDINKGWDGKVNGGSSVSLMDSYVYVINLRALANKHDYTYRGVINIVK